jgi:hypothetical protein
MENKYGLSTLELQQAQSYMVSQGYMDGTEDIIDYTRAMVEDSNFMVTAKIRQWSKLYEQSQTSK